MEDDKSTVRDLNRPDSRLLHRLERASIFFLVTAALIAGVVFFGWLLPVMGSVLPDGWWQMKANTSFSVLLCAACLALADKRGSVYMALIGHFCAGLVLLLAGTALYEHWSGSHTGLSTLLVRDDGSIAPGLMSVQSAVFLALLGLALFIDKTRQGWRGFVLDILNIFSVTLILIFFAGYFFSAANLIGQSLEIRTSPQTLTCFVLLTFVQINRRISYGYFSVLVGMGIGSYFARIMLPVSVVLSYMIIRTGERLYASGMLSLPTAAAVTSSIMAVLLLFVVVLLARRINRLEAELRMMSLSDELTGLRNQRGFQLLGEQSLLDARRDGRPATVLFIDADGLKKVNDNLGHETGSEMLRDIAELLRTTFRSSDVIGRVGGDEFAVIVRGTKNELAPVLRRMDEAIEVVNGKSGRLYRISLSKGAVTAEPGSNESLNELLGRADEIMYREKKQKHAGRSVVAEYDDESGFSASSL